MHYKATAAILNAMMDFFFFTGYLFTRLQSNWYVFLDPPNHGVDTKMTTLRRKLADL